MLCILDYLSTFWVGNVTYPELKSKGLFMDCVCSQTCTIRKNGKSIYIEKGQILDFDKCPENHFQALHDVEINFNEVSLDVLLQSKEWKTKDALAYLKKEFNHTPKGAITRREIAQMVIDRRMRKVTLPNEV